MHEGEGASAQEIDEAEKGEQAPARAEAVRSEEDGVQPWEAALYYLRMVLSEGVGFALVE